MLSSPLASALIALSLAAAAVLLRVVLAGRARARRGRGPRPSVRPLEASPAAARGARSASPHAAPKQLSSPSLREVARALGLPIERGRAEEPFGGAARSAQASHSVQSLVGRHRGRRAELFVCRAPRREASGPAENHLSVQLQVEASLEGWLLFRPEEALPTVEPRLRAPLRRRLLLSSGRQLVVRSDSTLVPHQVEKQLDELAELPYFHLHTDGRALRLRFAAEVVVELAPRLPRALECLCEIASILEAPPGALDEVPTPRPSTRIESGRREGRPFR